MVERSGSEQPSNQEEEQPQEGSLLVLFGKVSKLNIALSIQLQRTCTCKRVRTTPKPVTQTRRHLTNS